MSRAKNALPTLMASKKLGKVGVKLLSAIPGDYQAGTGTRRTAPRTPAPQLVPSTASRYRRGMDDTLARLLAGKDATAALLRQVADRLDALDGAAAGEALVGMEHAVGLLAEIAERTLGIPADPERHRAWHAGARPIGFMPAR